MYIQTRINASLACIGVVATGVMLLWFPTYLLRISLPDGIVQSTFITTAWQTIVLVIFPYYWASKKLGMSMSDLGINRHQLAKSTLLGCLLYSVALISFFYCSSGNMLSNHAVRYAQPLDAYTLMLLMGVTAATTDIVSRGFLLLSLEKYSNVFIAVIVQNIFWFIGHIHEIQMLQDCLGLVNAIILTLFLGVLGDVVVLRTRNVWGLAIPHFLMNVILTVYIRNFL